MDEGSEKEKKREEGYLSVILLRLLLPPSPSFVSCMYVHARMHAHSVHSVNCYAPLITQLVPVRGEKRARARAPFPMQIKRVGCRSRCGVA